MHATNLNRSPLWFLLPLCGVYAAAFGIVAALPRIDARSAVAFGLTLDLVVIVPALYYLVLVRGRGWPSISVVPVFLASFLAASWIVPAEHASLLGAIGYAVPVIELALIGYVLLKLRRVARAHGLRDEPDFLDRVRRTLDEVIGARVASRIAAYEMAIFRYAFSFGRSAALPVGGFGYRSRSGYGVVLAAILMAATLELFGVHLLLRMWSATAAWIHLVLSIYAVIWVVGDFRAMRLRPHRIDTERLRLRCGLRWDLDVETARVARVRRTDAGADLSMVPWGAPSHVVEFDGEVLVDGLYGLTRRVRSVGVTFDDPTAFEGRLRELGVTCEG